MTAVSGPTTPPLAQSLGCCERFTHFLLEIKNLAFRFFQWLFCYQGATPKPLSSTQILQSKDIKNVVFPQSFASSSNSSSSSTSSTSSDLLVTTPRRPDEGEAIVEGYCKALGKVEDDARLAVFTETGVLTLRCLSALDQLLMLQKCSAFLVIADWTAFIQALPSDIRNQIDPKNPKFDALHAAQQHAITQEPPAPKLFLHQMLHSIFLPREEMTLKHFSIEDIKEFQNFTEAEQFFILYTLFVIGMNDKKLHTHLNYTEIGKLLRHSKVKEKVCQQLLTDKIQINGKYIQNQKGLYEALREGPSISSWEELSRYFSCMQKIAVENPNWLLVNPLLSFPAPPQPLTSVPATSSPPVQGVNPLKEPRTFIIEFFKRFAKLRKDNPRAVQTVQADTLYTRIINGLAKPADQLFMLKKLRQDDAKCHFINRWDYLTDGLSHELHALIEPELVKVDGIEEMSFSYVRIGQNVSNRVWVMDKLDLVLEALIKNPSPGDAPSAPHKEFLQEMLFYICSPISITQTLPTADYLKRFSSFKTHEKAEILLSLLNIAKEMEYLELTKQFNIDYILLNCFWGEMREKLSYDPMKIPDDVTTSDLWAYGRLCELLEKVMQAK